MDDIGSTDDTALLCHTNKVLPKVIGGDWFDPDGTKVGDVNRPGGVPGVERNRGPHVVRLKRSSSGTPPEGMYKCVVRDTTDINQTVYVGIYSGICNTCLVCSIVFFISVTSTSVFISSSMVTGNSVTFNSFIFVTISAVNLSSSVSSTKTNAAFTERTLFSHSTRAPNLGRTFTEVVTTSMPTPTEPNPG